jgi:hypothetical protein
MKPGHELHGWNERAMETERDLALDGGTCVPSFGVQRRKLVDPAGDGGWVGGPGNWGWDRIELRSAGWRTCDRVKHSTGTGPNDAWERAGRMDVA